MAKSRIIRAEENSSMHSRESIGGKGSYLLKLHQAAKDIGSFQVPDFFIIPTQTGKSSEVYDSNDVKKAFDRLTKPLAVRSSSPLEDGVSASFAGMFASSLGVSSFEEFKKAYEEVINSPDETRVRKYAERMNIKFDPNMAVIVQEQVVDPWLKGIIQLDDEYSYDASFRCEFLDRDGKPDTYDFRYEYFEHVKGKQIHKPRENPEFISETDYWALGQAAMDAKKALGLEGIVQVEACFPPDKPIQFVQIRKLPDVNSFAADLELDVPKGVPYIEGEVCNDISGELVLPAYVTVSQSGLTLITTPNGMARWDERADIFTEQSKLSNNSDFNTALEQERCGFTMHHHQNNHQNNPTFGKMWKRGNDFFKEYILVCDRLDDSIYDMNDFTPDKKAIITCLRAEKASHAMTVARDLGIMCMGTLGDVSDMDYFFNQVETGDLVHMKSDGGKAVAYIERKRENDPYECRK